MYRPSDPRSRGRPTRDQSTKSYLPHQVSGPYLPGHVENTATEYSRDPRLPLHQGPGQGRDTASHVAADGNSYHAIDGRNASFGHDPRSLSLLQAANLRPNDTVVRRTSDSSEQMSKYSSPSQPVQLQPRPLFPTATTTGHGHTIGHPPHSSHHIALSPRQQLPPRDGNVGLPPPAPPPSWRFNPSHPTFPMMPRPPHPSFPRPTPPPPFSPTHVPFTATPRPPLPSPAVPLVGVMDTFPTPPPTLPPALPAAAGSPLPFPPPPRGLPPPPLPHGLPNFPLPLPIIPPPSSHSFIPPRFVPPSIQQTQKYHRSAVGEVPGFKPAPKPVGIEETLGLKMEKNKAEGESSEEMGRLSFEEDYSDRFISDWLKRVEGSYLRHQQHREEVKRNSIKVSCQPYLYILELSTAPSGLYDGTVANSW